MATALKPGNRVTITGAGRTGKWSPTTGTVTTVRRNRVYVHWDGTMFEDEMQTWEVRPAEPQDPTGR